MLTIKQCTKEEWENFIGKQESFPVFHASSFFEALNQDYKAFFITKNGTLKAGFILPVNNDSIKSNHFGIYSGLIIDKEVNQTNKSKYNNDSFKIIESFANFIGDKFKNIEFSNSTEIYDSRPFLWYKYFGNKREQLKINNRYTAHLTIDENLNQEHPVFHNFEYTKKNLIRQYTKKECIKFRSITKNDTHLISSLYIDMMERQANKNYNDDEKRKIEISIRNILNLEYAKPFAIYENNELAYSGIWLVNKDTAYYLLGCNVDVKKFKYAGVAFIWESLMHFSRLGIKTIDLEGVNSPKRGWNKMSYGCDLKIYYEIERNYELN